MSSDKLTRFKINEGKIEYTYSPNNVFPRVYYNHVEDATERNFEGIVMEIIYGCLHITSATPKLKEIEREMRPLYNELNTVSDVSKDIGYKLENWRFNSFVELFVKNVGMPIFRKHYKMEGVQTIDVNPLKEHEEESSRIYAKAKKAMEAIA
jgi:hypothetical protein